MSLPTPPATDHRGRRPSFSDPGPSRVVWSDVHKIYPVYDTPNFRVTVPKSALKEAPGKSILKRTNFEDLPPLEPAREITPEPSDPLTNLEYLVTPVCKIVSSTSTLRDLIEAYNVLAARLRACVTGITDADASWPLFQPLRKYREQLVDSMVRDLGRALEDPKTSALALELDAENIPIDPELLVSGFPTPQSPKPKKKGMSAERVKYARDLCTVCHSVLKLLSAIFTFSAVYRVFTDKQLGFLLTNVLGIPLAAEIPTPNARKTCALAIWLIQSQRLPEDILMPARDRIAYALRRGIDGELGKEGKKGSASDGLKAIHDLSLCYPAVFVPAFANMLPSIFKNLLAPTLTLRVQACTALGGFAFGLASLPISVVHTHVAVATNDFLTKKAMGAAAKKPQSPAKDLLIIRTLRTTLSAVDPKHPAQGPVWALSLLANFVVLLGPIVYLEERLTKLITAMFSLAMRHQKSSVRALASLVWRTMTWAYFRGKPTKLVDASKDSDDEDDAPPAWSETEEEIYRTRMQATWKVVESVVDLGAGVATIGAALGTTHEIFDDNEDTLMRVFNMLKAMGKKGGSMTSDALDVLCRLVNPIDDSEWDQKKLLPLSLFSSNPGLLTSDYKQLAPVVRPIFDECPMVDDIRCLTQDELSFDWVFDKVIEQWKDALMTLKLLWGSEFPVEVTATWEGILKANVTSCKDADDDEGFAALATNAGDLLCAILKSKKLDLALQVTEDTDFLAPTSPVKPDDEEPSEPQPSTNPRGLPPLPSYRWRPALKLLLVRELWQSAQQIFPVAVLKESAQKMLDMLMDKQEDLVVETQLTDEVRGQWALLCAETAYRCEDDALAQYWNADTAVSTWPEAVRSFVWSHFIMKWKEEKGAEWESGVVLLGAPFIDPMSWEMTPDDLDEWDGFLRLTMDRALDHGVDSVSVVDHVASVISSQYSPSSLSATRVAQHLLSHLELGEARTLPDGLFTFINDTLSGTYPPESDEKVPSLWFLRALGRTMESCPNELVENMLEAVQNGLSIWMSDGEYSLAREEYELDVVSLYDTVAACLLFLPRDVDTLRKFGQILAAPFHGRDDKSAGVKGTFLDFWSNGYAEMLEPKGGWSDDIATCLRAAGLSKESEEDAQDDDEVEAQLTDLPPSGIPSSDDYVLSPEIPNLSTGNPFLLSEPESPLVPTTTLGPFPRTPRTARPTTPTRDRREASPTRPVFPFVATEAALSKSVFPVTPKRRTGGQGRAQASPRKADKENESPLRAIPTIIERIGLTPASNPTTPASRGRKRGISFSEDRAEGEREGRSAKRSRNDLSASLSEAVGRESRESSPERRDRENLILTYYTPVATASKAAPRVGPPSSAKLPPAHSLPETSSRGAEKPALKTSKSVAVMEAVEVPTLASIRRRDAIAKATPAKQTSPRKVHSTMGQAAKSAGGLSPTKRRAVSLTKAVNILKPSRNADSDSEYELESEEDASPLKGLRNMASMNSDDSFSMETPSLSHSPSKSSFSLSDPLSSDDNLHRYAGVVTPHHVVSPAPRRLADPFDIGEAGSDDSNLSASPIKEHVARMSGMKNKHAARSLDAHLTPLRLPLSASVSSNGR